MDKKKVKTILTEAVEQLVAAGVPQSGVRLLTTKVPGANVPVMVLVIGESKRDADAVEIIV